MSLNWGEKTYVIYFRGRHFFWNVYWKILAIVTKAVPKDLGCEDGRWVGVMCSDELCDKPVF